ncbi:gluconate 2-dehydrogenase subunit 3 family protein [Galbibacter mesophilus]|uniref:gluconate 2-dehydrogenase subunit 3 family protein n=1 Tax=Galbibacter mesophilus TaxID=379069 RepID=UPI0019202F19|nr:gluconate 2-dehydrogenase subunit 3 family protein [Galbibacter mesophilus]MCM5663850.1 gluconate 2-dehydrogenase subunit 3 family protein [Galbibacter mesophilus]
MERRKALKNIGLSFGYVAATPTLFSILQSCKKDVSVNWKPVFFAENQALMLENLVDLILPTTENLPGAKELNIPMFIDLSFEKLLEENEKELLKKGATHAAAILESDDYSKEVCDSLLDSYFNAPAETQHEYLENASKENPNEKALIYYFLNKVRSNTIWAYKQSEFIGEKVLVYDPVPGPFQGCIDWDNKLGYSLS